MFERDPEMVYEMHVPRLVEFAEVILLTTDKRIDAQRVIQECKDNYLPQRGTDGRMLLDEVRRIVDYSETGAFYNRSDSLLQLVMRSAVRGEGAVQTKIAELQAKFNIKTTTSHSIFIRGLIDVAMWKRALGCCHDIVALDISVSRWESVDATEMSDILEAIRETPSSLRRLTIECDEIENAPRHVPIRCPESLAPLPPSLDTLFFRIRHGPLVHMFARAANFSGLSLKLLCVELPVLDETSDMLLLKMFDQFETPPSRFEITFQGVRRSREAEHRLPFIPESVIARSDRLFLRMTGGVWENQMARALRGDAEEGQPASDVPWFDDVVRAWKGQPDRPRTLGISVCTMVDDRHCRMLIDALATSGLTKLTLELSPETIDGFRMIVQAIIDGALVLDGIRFHQEHSAEVLVDMLESLVAADTPLRTLSFPTPFEDKGAQPGRTLATRILLAMKRNTHLTDIAGIGSLMYSMSFDEIYALLSETFVLRRIWTRTQRDHIPQHLAAAVHAVNEFRKEVNEGWVAWRIVRRNIETMQEARVRQARSWIVTATNGKVSWSRLPMRVLRVVSSYFTRTNSISLC